MIVAVKDRDRVLFAFSAFDTVYPVTVEDMANPENAGVWKVKGNPHTVMGCMFPSAETDAFKYADKLFWGDINYDTLTDFTVPAMERYAEGKDYIGDDKDRYEELLIAQDGKLFKITSERLVLEADSYDVISNGVDEFVKSVMQATEGEPPMDRIRKAFEFSAAVRQSNCYPLLVMDTETRKIRTLKR